MRSIVLKVLAVGCSCILSMSLNATTLELSTLDGHNGFVIEGIDFGDKSGTSVSYAGDINGDGIDDVIVGAPGRNGFNSPGESYIVFGTAGGFSAGFDLASLDGRNGFLIRGIRSGDLAGHSVSAAGDINGDGIDDVVIGAPFAPFRTAGDTYVVFGRTSGFAPVLELDGLDGRNGFVLGGSPYSESGASVSSAGDVNGDGIDDIIIGEPYYINGHAYVVFGTTSGFPAKIYLGRLDGSDGFEISGASSNDSTGMSVSSAGDINGDGIDDVIIGAPRADSDVYAGESYVVFGTSSGFPRSTSAANIDGSNGFVIRGVAAGDESGTSVSSAGDINGDGIDDVIIGAPNADLAKRGRRVGASYVVFGSDSDFGPVLNLASLDGRNGFAIRGVNSTDRSGASVSAAGDFNGDGLDDVIVGASRAFSDGRNDVGLSYIVFGYRYRFPANVFLEDAFQMKGGARGDLSGTSVASAGDINSDGFGDVIIGAPLAKSNGTSTAGQSYVVFGSNEFGAYPSRELVATAATDRFFATFGLDRIVFGQGTSTTAAIDTVYNIVPEEDVIDVSALGLSPDDIELRIVGEGAFLKMIDGYGANDFQLKIELNELSVDDVLSLIVWGGTANGNRIVATTAQETLRGTAANDTFVFAEGTSTRKSLDTLTGWALGDTIDLAGLGVSTNDIETRIIAGDTVLKLIEGFGANDFQLKINLGANNSQEVIDSITVQGGSNSGGNVINATAAADILIATDASDRFVFIASSSTSSAIDTVLGWRPGDTIDLSALSLSAGDIEFKTVADGTILKIVEGYDADDFQLKVHLNGFSANEMMGSIVGLFD